MVTWTREALHTSVFPGLPTLLRQGECRTQSQLLPDDDPQTWRVTQTDRSPSFPRCMIKQTEGEEEEGVRGLATGVEPTRLGSSGNLGGGRRRRGPRRPLEGHENGREKGNS